MQLICVDDARQLPDSRWNTEFVTEFQLAKNITFTWLCLIKRFYLPSVIRKLRNKSVQSCILNACLATNVCLLSYQHTCTRTLRTQMLKNLNIKFMVSGFSTRSLVGLRNFCRDKGVSDKRKYVKITQKCTPVALKIRANYAHSKTRDIKYSWG